MVGEGTECGFVGGVLWGKGRVKGSCLGEVKWVGKGLGAGKVKDAGVNEEGWIPG